jgi:peptide chain release factor
VNAAFKGEAAAWLCGDAHSKIVFLKHALYRFGRPRILRGQTCIWQRLRLEIFGRLWQTAAMTAFPVNPEKEQQLAQRMAALGVRESDIDETFVRSGGHGGQNVNKSSTCVMLLHRPSGLQVKCQETRQQGLNRFIARRLLLDKIEALQTGQVAAEQARVEKVRRQKRKRSRRAKERMLADKSRNADKKASRRAAGNWM